MQNIAIFCIHLIFLKMLYRLKKIQNKNRVVRADIVKKKFTPFQYCDACVTYTAILKRILCPGILAIQALTVTRYKMILIINSKSNL